MQKSDISSILRLVVKQLVNADYISLYESDLGKLILPEEMKLAIDSYPGKLTYPPESYFDLFEMYGTVNDKENLVEFTLWYDNEPSDLTLSITTVETGRYSLEDIRVM